MPENPNYEPIKITEDNELIIWGIVTYVVKKIMKRKLLKTLTFNLFILLFLFSAKKKKRMYNYRMV